MALATTAATVPTPLSRYSCGGLPVVKMWVSSGRVGVDPVKMSSNLAAVCLVGGSMEGRATHRLQHWHRGIIIANM